MRSIDNCYRKCFLPFAVSCCCWRWYNNNVEELPRWSLLWLLSHFFNSIETASKAIAFNSGSGFFLFFSLFFCIQNGRMISCYCGCINALCASKNVRLCVIFIFFASLLNWTLVHRLYFLIISFDATFAFFLCC